MNKPTIGIIGFGMVGKAIQHGFAQLCDFSIYDINPLESQNTLEEVAEDSDFIFICVPSPMNINTGKCDLSIVRDTLKKLKELRSRAIIIIKSTIPPGTTEKFREEFYPLDIVFNPEFLTARTSKLDFINSSRIIIGGQYEILDKVEDLYRMRFPHTPIFRTDPTTAELVKYTANTFFATKLSFFNEIYDICEELNIDYNDVIKMTIADQRIGNSHYTIPGHDGLRGYGGLCFPKDINALIYKAKELGINPIILKAVWKKNLEVRKKRDWEEIEGAISNKTDV